MVAFHDPTGYGGLLWLQLVLSCYRSLAPFRNCGDGQEGQRGPTRTVSVLQEGDVTLGRNLYNGPASDPRLKRACTFWKEWECHISPKLPHGIHFHLLFPALAYLHEDYRRHLELRDSSVF